MPNVCLLLCIELLTMQPAFMIAYKVAIRNFINTFILILSLYIIILLIKHQMNLSWILCGLLFAVALSADIITYQGIMQAAKKTVIAKDMLYILKTVFQNAKFWDYPDVKQEEHNGAFTKGMYLTDIDITSVELDIKPLINTLVLTPETQKITLKTNKPALKYVVSFKWRSEAMGIHIAFGKGNATMTSKGLIASYGLIGMTSELEASFNVELIDVTGPNQLMPGVKDWILGSLKNHTYPALLAGIEYNRHFIADHMHAQFQKLNKRIDGSHVLQYISHPASVTEVGDYLFYSHKVALLVNGELAYEVTEQTPIELAPIKRDIGIFLSPQLIPLTLDIQGMLKVYSGNVDMTLFGFTGTIKDLFEAMPELATLYNEDEKINMHCDYFTEKMTELPERMYVLPMRCDFAIPNQKPILSVKVLMKTKITPNFTQDVNALYVATLSEVVPQKCTPTPQTLELNLFSMQLFRAFGRAILEGKTVHAPMIRYEPYREYQLSETTVQNGVYVTYYDEEISLEPKL